MFETTIAAIATGIGGAIGIVRLSGPESLAIAKRIWRPLIEGTIIKSRKMHLGYCYDDERQVEQALLVYMPGPYSYTGEDVVELQCHGGIFTTRMILSLLYREGAKSAEAGEFTRRAFINGKMDLTQAEAVVDIIEAHSERALQSASRQLDGSLGRRINEIYDRAEHLLSEIEVRMDFVDEDLDFDSQQVLKASVQALALDVQKLNNSRHNGEVLRHGIKIVLAGAPNAGKSSLMNLFLGRDRAIVTDIAGTTRDVLEEFANINGIPIRLFDTAGIRDAIDEVERIGVDRSISYLKEAGVILWIVDSTVAESMEDMAVVLEHAEKVIVVANKVDSDRSHHLEISREIEMVRLSALTGEGFDKLLKALERRVWSGAVGEDLDIAVNSRHGELLERALEELMQVERAIEEEYWEIVAVGLRGALRHIGSITGRAVSPDILDNIFSRFCIGK
ncbi:MAG: tRNA uridine-5-carboxymethylaminomethyl(34) synthesis GTPase MnmE [Lentisphaeria bacterium]